MRSFKYDLRLFHFVSEYNVLVTLFYFSTLLPRKWLQVEKSTRVLILFVIHVASLEQRITENQSMLKVIKSYRAHFEEELGDGDK